MVSKTRSIGGVGFAIFLAVIVFSSAGMPFKSFPSTPELGFGVNDSIDDDSLKFPFPDYQNRPDINRLNSPLFLNQPSNIQSEISYDPRTGKFIFTDKIGSFNYRNPYSMDFDDYLNYSRQKSQTDYWQERMELESASDDASGVDRLINQNLVVPIKGFDKIFGSNTVAVNPQGDVQIDFGVNISNVENPTLPQDLQRTVTFDFKPKIKMGVNGKIGEKLNIGINYDTEATFEFENNVKLAFEGDEDEIIQNIEAGNVSMPLSGSLITGSHSLFGLKTELQFGRLSMTNVVSQQKGEIKTIEVEGGAMTTPFEITADDYEEGKHYFLTHYFRENYDEALKDLPLIRSAVTITKVEVWVTNRSGNFENSRNIVAFSDLGEEDQYMYNDFFTGHSGFPDNEVNDLYAAMNSTYSSIRDISQVSSTLSQISGFNQGVDYEKVQNARKLESSEFYFHPTLGYVSLNSALKNDEVLAVSFEFIAGGETFRVGEFSNEEPPAPQSLFLKLIKPTTLSTELPTWDLMMKNVYSINAYQVNSQEFIMEVMYRDDKTGTSLNYLPAGKINGKPLLSVMNLDEINKNGDPQSDGFFDFIDKVTINASNGRIYFPVTEPFGDHLRMKITDGDTQNPELNRLAEQYVFDELYESTQSQARQAAEKNKFFLKGSYRSAGGSEINLNAMNVPEGSVSVTAGGQKLTENVDYTVDYNLGRVSILNQSLLESGSPIKISLESNSMFNIGTKTFLGTRLDYRLNEEINLGATLLHLNRKPLTTKINIGNEPISNTIWGTDFTINRELPFLTKLTDKIPFIETKERSTLDFQAEFAQLIPGHPKAVGEEGFAHVDDFEAAETSLDLKTPSRWKLASTPLKQPGLFPEADSINSLMYGYNRAKLAWYIVNTDFLRNTSTTPDYITLDDQSDHRIREVYEQELFPNRDPVHGVPPVLSVLNIAYYPAEKGPYNYDVEPVPGISQGMNANGFLNAPETRWGGIMRSLTTNDFEEANIEYIELWLMDPFHYEDNQTGGEVYFNLGSISEDILRDSRQSFENGLPTGPTPENVDTTVWGRVPLLPRITEGFANDPADARQYQDVGFDGLNDTDEGSYFGDYLETIRNLHSAQSNAYINAAEDPSNDNYMFFKSEAYDADRATIAERYKRFNNQEGNSGNAQDGQTGMTSGEQHPDMEDINRDYTLSESETYFQYKLDLRPELMQVGDNYITDIKESTVTLKNDNEETIKWYHLKIPIREYSDKIGPIEDFKSIRFMRLFMKNWQEETILRLAEMDLVRSEWRKYDASLIAGNEGTGTPEITEADFEISSVNIEENAYREPVNYVLPPGLTREISPDQPQLRELNEQAISVKVLGLDDGDARAAYKNVSLDMRQFERLQMFVHAEAIEDRILNDNDVCVFIRLGSDYKENYYEYEIPLKLTEFGWYQNDSETDREIVWPTENFMDMTFEELQLVKQHRNSEMREPGSSLQLTSRYSEYLGERKISVTGNPNLSNVRTIMIGIRNRSAQINVLEDDGMEKAAEVWLNELRLAGFNEQGGWAAQSRLSINLADFSTLAVSGDYSTPGFGSLEKRVNERQISTDYSYDFSSNFELGKFFPQKYGVHIPLYFGYSESFSDPQYNPVDPDIELKTTLSDPNFSQADKDSLLQIYRDYIKRKSVNLTNVRIEGNSEKQAKKKSKKKNMGRGRASNVKPFYHVSNWTAGYGYNEIFMRNVNTHHNLLQEYNGALAYNYNISPKAIRPFTNVKLFRNKAFRIIKDFNFYYQPSVFAFRNELNKTYNEIQMRNVEQPLIELDTTFSKQFTWNRVYDVRYSLSRSLKFTYSASNTSWIQEPYGRIDRSDPRREQKLDTTWNSIKNLGDARMFHQKISGNWNIPINKLPLLGWTNATARYDADFFWDQGPITEEADSVNLGHTAKNNQRIQLNSQLNLDRLYRKVSILKKADDRFSKRGRSKKKKYETVQYSKENLDIKKGESKKFFHRLNADNLDVKFYDKDKKIIKGEVEEITSEILEFTPEQDVEDGSISVKGKREVKDSPLRIVGDYFLYTLMSVRNVSLSYSETNATIVPGFDRRSKFFGFDSDWDAPGYPFLLGIQNQDYGRLASENGWLTGDSLVNAPIVMNSNKGYDIKATLEPLAGLRLDVSANRNMVDNFQEFWYEENGIAEGRNEIHNGSFSISTITIRTAFNSINDTTYSSAVYNQFLDNRNIIAGRLATSRAGLNSAYDPTAPVINIEGDTLNVGYPNGYSSVSQEVLIPAFIAAYTKQSGADVNTAIFTKFPLPNWRLKYDGLTNYEFVKKRVKKILITHGYRSSYIVNSFQSNLDFEFDQFESLGYSSARSEQSELFIPHYQINGVAVDEKFTPLIGVDVMLKNDISLKAEYSQARSLALSFANNQLIEAKNREYIFGFGYKIPDLELPIAFGNNQQLLKSDLNIRADFTYREMMSIVRRITEEDNQLSAGQENISVKLSADYELNKRVNIRLFYDQVINRPKVSTAYNTSNTKVGFSIRFDLVPN